MFRPVQIPVATEQAVAPARQVAERPAALVPPAARVGMRHRFLPAPASRHLTNYATDRRRNDLHLPLLKKRAEAFVSSLEILVSVPAHPNENADQEHEHQIKRDFLFGVHPHVPEQRKRIATATTPRSAQTKRQISVTVIAPPPVTLT